MLKIRVQMPISVHENVIANQDADTSKSLALNVVVFLKQSNRKRENFVPGSAISRIMTRMGIIGIRKIEFV